ncbi:MAG TPA: hypothetical protein VFF76_00370 [Holophagaceae bacterium]|nr:hypothetical protein [Holophagaceae bacterium]
MERFKLSITLGNDAMQTSDDIATALERVAEHMRNGSDGGAIHDENGNAVGHFEVED